MSKIFLFFSAVLIIAGCGVRKPVLTDSVYVERTVERLLRDTVIDYILPDSSLLSVILPADTSHLETQAAVSDAWIDSAGMLNHTLRNKLLPLPVEISIPEVKTTENRYLMRTVTKEVERDFTHWQSFLLVMGKIMLGILTAGILVGVFFVMKKFRIFGL